MKQEFPRAESTWAFQPRRRVYMKRLTALITGLQVLSHAIFGCCADSSHGRDVSAAGRACSQSCCSSMSCCASQKVRPQADGVDGPGPDGAAPRKPTSPEPTHQCPHDGCEWIDQKDGAPPVSQLVELAYLPPAALCDYQTVRAVSTDMLRDGAAQDFSPPVRLHLRLNVLLI